MFVDTPQNTIRIAALDDCNYLLEMRKSYSMFYFEHRDKMLTAQNYIDVAEYMSELTESKISVETATAILELFPYARIQLAVYNDIGDTETRSSIADAVSTFFLGCSWPTYDDSVDISEFTALLKNQVAEMIIV